MEQLGFQNYVSFKLSSSINIEFKIVLKRQNGDYVGLKCTSERIRIQNKRHFHISKDAFIFS